jgi:hypothetical protein
MASPSLEMIALSHGTSVMMIPASREVLIEGSGAYDGRGVVASRLVDVVIAAVAVDAAYDLAGSARVIVTERFDDAVLGKWAFLPAVD